MFMLAAPNFPAFLAAVAFLALLISDIPYMAAEIGAVMTEYVVLAPTIGAAS